MQSQNSNKPQIPTVMKDDRTQLLTDMNRYFKQQLYKVFPSYHYCKYSLVGPMDEDRKKVEDIFKNREKDIDISSLNLSLKRQRAVASVLGMAICDALGACTEFSEYIKGGYGIIKNGFKDIKQLIEQRQLRSRHGEVTIWTDDASMGLCMAYSLLVNKFVFDPKHMRYMFILWLQNGLGNGGRKHSIGLGGNISISMDEFFKKQQDYCEKGNQFNNGNGSLMRLAPVPIAFYDDREKAIEYSGLQSLTTHNGLQAKQCSRLMAAILVDLINRKQDEDWREVLEKTCASFKVQQQQALGVQVLAKSQQQSHQMYQENAQKYKTFVHFNKKLTDRNWNWKDPAWSYSETRHRSQPGYVGSYCMDALAMALHTVWNTKSFKECAILNANLGGDCDTVGSIAGQIAGAAYGIDQEMLRLYSEMDDVEKQRYEVFLVGLKLTQNKEKQITDLIQI